MKLQSLSMENFCSYKKESIDFTKFQDNKILIFGENRDEEGLDSNGSGKTNILNAICWALSSKTSKRGKIGVNDIIGPWSNETKVTLKLSGQFDLKIERVKKDKGSDLKFWINDKPKHVIDNTEKTQHNLLYYLGVPKEHYKKWFEDFMNTYYFSKEIAQVFTGVTSTKSDKFQFISRFMNLRLLDLSKENTKSKLDMLVSEISLLSSQVSTIKDRLEGMSSKDELQKEIKELEITITRDRQEITDLTSILEKVQEQYVLTNDIKNKKEMLIVKSKDLEEKLGILKNQYDIKIEEYDSLEELTKELDSMQEELETINVHEFYKETDNIIAQLFKRNEHISELKSKIDSNTFAIKDYKNKLKNADKCPKCEAPLMYLDGKIVDLNPKALQDEINIMEKQLFEFNESLNKLKQEEKEAEKRSKKVQDTIQQYENLKRKSDTWKIRSENKDKLGQEINDIMAQKRTFESTVSELISKLKLELKELEDHLSKMPQYQSVDIVKKNIETLGYKIEEMNKSKQRNEFILEKIDEDITAKESAEVRLREMKDKEEKLNFIINGFPEIIKARIDEFIPQFKVESNNFMNQLRSKIKIVIDTDRETKKGTLVDEFPIEAIDIHGKKRGLETYSEGEKSRISISIAWALRALTRKKVYLPFQFNMLDEIADGLDESGIDFLNKIMGDDDQYLVITHFSHFKNKFSSSIKAIRENGQSFVETIQ